MLARYWHAWCCDRCGKWLDGVTQATSDQRGVSTKRPPRRTHRVGRSFVDRAVHRTRQGIPQAASNGAHQIQLRFYVVARSPDTKWGPVDVFASADITSQDRLSASGNIVSSPTVFARNTMQIAVKPGNPYAVRNVADLARVKVVALCGAAVPCGVYAATVLNLAKTTLPTTMITRGVDAKATLAAVTLGDADAAIVYATDVRQAGKQAQGVAIPAAQNVKAMYAISVVRGAANRAAAQAFVKFIVSAEGQTILRAFGFLAP